LDGDGLWRSRRDTTGRRIATVEKGS